MLFARRKQLKNLSVLSVNWKRYNSGAGYLYTFERDLTLNYEAGKVNLTIAWKCFDVVNGNASTLASRLLQCGIDCRDRCVQQGYTGSHDEKKNDFRIQVCFCSYGLSGLKNDSSCTWCSIKWSLVSHNSNFHAFFSLRFPQYLGSWNRLISTWRNFGENNKNGFVWEWAEISVVGQNWILVNIFQFPLFPNINYK